MGTGESEGKFEDADVETFLSDIGCAMRTLNAKIPGLNDVGLIGLRFGATLAALATERSDVSRLILWDPVIDGNQYMQEILRSNLMTQTVIFKKVQKDRKMLIQDLMEGKTVTPTSGSGESYARISEVRLNERVNRFKIDVSSQIENQDIQSREGSDLKKHRQFFGYKRRRAVWRETRRITAGPESPAT
jgi:hypothetical protein